MKKIFVLFLMAISSYTIAQSSIQPSLGLNIWNASLGGFGSATATFFEIGADYEHAIKEKIAFNGGASYNVAANSSGGGFFELNLGGRYNLKN